MENHKILAEEWFCSARSDYDYAKIGLQEKQIFPQIAFLSQQIAEKYLKGFLILNGNIPSRIHDLPKLLDACIKIDPKMESLRDACELLTGFYIESRYPPDIPNFTKKEIFEAFTNAEKVKDTIETSII